MSARANQKGSALLAFTVVLAIVTFTVVLGFSISATKKQSVSLAANQKAYLDEVRDKLAMTYAANSLTIDSEANWRNLTAGADLLALAGVAPRWGVEAAISPPISREGVSFRVMAAWLSVDDAAAGAPVMAPDGTFTPCPDNTADCKARRLYVVTDGFAIQRANVKKALAQLGQLAANAQSFFKTKQLLDPERNVSTNHFRSTQGSGCNGSVVEQLPCLPTLVPIFSAVPRVALQNNAGQNVTELLGLASTPLLNPWGLPVEACNTNGCDIYSGQATTHIRSSASDGPPFSMLFRTATPWGDSLSVYALQQL